MEKNKGQKANVIDDPYPSLDLTTSASGSGLQDYSGPIPFWLHGQKGLGSRLTLTSFMDTI